MSASVKVYSTDDRILIHHLKNLLQSEGIDCFINNDLLYALAGEVPVNEVLPELWLFDSRRLHRAQSIIDNEIRPVNQGSLWTCHQCGERHDPQFTSCWNCAADKSQS